MKRFLVPILVAMFVVGMTMTPNPAEAAGGSEVGIGKTVLDGVLAPAVGVGIGHIRGKNHGTWSALAGAGYWGFDEATDYAAGSPTSPGEIAANLLLGAGWGLGMNYIGTNIPDLIRALASLGLAVGDNVLVEKFFDF